MLTDRSDISEETARLRIHSTQLESILGSGGDILNSAADQARKLFNSIMGK